MKLAFVVLTYNRPDALLAVLHALAPQCTKDSLVVVADDGSREENVRIVAGGLPRFACPVRQVWHPDMGFTAARARNLGVAFGTANAQPDYIVFLDGDCVPTAHFVDAHLALAQAGAFVNGSRVLLSRKLTDQVLSGTVQLPQLGAASWAGLRLTGGVNKLSHLLHLPSALGRVQRDFRWKGIRSCNFGVWYRDFQAVNGFDETFSGWGHEDADLVLRLHHAGLQRRNGWLATEVFHLWHGENSRAGEAANRAKVEQRAHSDIVRAERGLAELASGLSPTVTELN